MKKKKLLYLRNAAVLSLALTLTGCAQTQNTSEAVSESSVQETVAAPQEESGTQETQTTKSQTQQNESEASSDIQGELHPVIEENLSQLYSDDGSTLLCEARSPVIKLEDEGYDNLKKSLEEYSSQRADSLAGESAEIKNAAQEQLSTFPDSFYPYNITYTAEICRADAQIFSFTEQQTSYTGGAHDNAAIVGHTYDSQTGEELQLTDVVSDPDALYEYLLDFLQNGGCDGLFDGWEETVRQEVFGETVDGYTYKLQWTLTPDGMNVYFSPYDIGPWAMGTITVSIPYGQPEIGIAGF